MEINLDKLIAALEDNYLGQALIPSHRPDYKEGYLAANRHLIEALEALRGQR